MRDPKMILVIEEERQAAVLENDRLRAELADAKAVARYETDCVEAAKEHITKLDAELGAKDARIAELDRDIAAKAHNLTYLNARAERAEADCVKLRASLEHAFAAQLATHRSSAAVIQRAEAERDALLYNAESRYCAGMSAGFELGRNDDRAELSRIITQRWKEIADAKARAALAPSPARQGSIPDRTFERDLAELRAVDRMRAERDSLREALEFYANEDRYDYDETCCEDNRNPGGVLNDGGEVARAALNPSPAGEKS